MRLDLRAIIHKPGASLPFDFSMDLSKEEIGEMRPFTRGVQVTGAVKNTAGALTLRGEVTAGITLNCDRCTQSYEADKTVPFQFLLAEELAGEDDEEIVLLEDGKLDIEELAYTALILGMDTKYLCSESCKGLCPGCGVDLNHEACRCKPEIDPRWAALTQLLDKTE